MNKSAARLVALCIAAGLYFAEIKTSAAADPQIVTVNKGQTADAYFQVNMSGTVFVSIGAPPGQKDCAEFWWINWPLGSIKSLGRHCGFAQFEIPGLLDLSISSKLRVGGGESDLKLGISASESVARSISFSF